MASYAQWGNDLYSGKRSYNIIRRSWTWLGISIGVVVVSLVLLFARGLNPSIEFSGGTQFIISGTQSADQQIAYQVLADDGVSENVRVSQLGTDSIRVQSQTLDTAQTTELRSALAEAYDVSVDEVDTSSVGATWGQDVTKKALQSIVIFVVLVLVLMAAYFRSWAMSTAALIALANDLLVTVGFFALTHVEVSPATVIGFLTILGYSLYDTVVVFDKVREVTSKFPEQDKYTYGELVNLGVNQTLVRSINTSVVALLPVSAILFIGSLMLGAGTLTDISLALFVGMFVGALSSVFIGPPALALLQGRRSSIKEKNEKILAARAEAAKGSSSDMAVDQRVTVAVAGRSAGRHLGQQAQPKRKKGNK